MENNETMYVEEPPIIQADHVVVEHRKNPTEYIRAVDDISLSIWRGEFVALYGPAEAGKTSLLQVLSGLNKPTSGQIIIDGQDVTKLPTNKLASLRSERFGFLFHTHHLVNTLTIIENVMLPLRYRKMSAQESERVAGEWLVRVGLGERLYHRPSELNANEQQRAALARSLVNEPMIIFADEPTANMDLASAQQLIELMRGLNYTFGQTYIVTTNDEQIASMCDRAVRINKGRIEDDTSWHYDNDVDGVEVDTELGNEEN
ncbi:MAG TPA: ABC transporter ATP-binding protein [Firmicutes bacterium]|nr:ABC transporter ATP-binding protein [Bacillota bacterium]